MVLLGGFTVLVRRRRVFLTDGNFIIWSGGGLFPTLIFVGRQ